MGSGLVERPSDLTGRPSDLAGQPSHLAGSPSDLAGKPFRPSCLADSPLCLADCLLMLVHWLNRHRHSPLKCSWWANFYNFHPILIRLGIEISKGGIQLKWTSCLDQPTVERKNKKAIPEWTITLLRFFKCFLMQIFLRFSSMIIFGPPQPPYLCLCLSHLG